jgi:hypothetical protein
MNELMKKILESGLVDEATAKLMEKWQALPEGSAELTQGRAVRLSEETQEVLTKFAEGVGYEVEKQRKLRETVLDLQQLKWPVNAMIVDPRGDVRTFVSGLMDRFGRYYFRPQDVMKEWFVPGFTLCRQVANAPSVLGPGTLSETILEVTELYAGDEVIAIQVSTQ